MNIIAKNIVNYTLNIYPLIHNALNKYLDKNILIYP